jgi:hypothetical protein
MRLTSLLTEKPLFSMRQVLVEEKTFHRSSAKLTDLRPYFWGLGIRERYLPMENGPWPTQRTRPRKCSCIRRGPGKHARSRMTKLTITVLHGYQMASMSSLLDPSRDILDDCIGWTWGMGQPVAHFCGGILAGVHGLSGVSMTRDGRVCLFSYLRTLSDLYMFQGVQ